MDGGVRDDLLEAFELSSDKGTVCWQILQCLSKPHKSSLQAHPKDMHKRHISGIFPSREEILRQASWI